LSAELKVTPPEVQQVLEDQTASYWLKESLQSALMRDPVDALNDALLLASLLDTRLRIVLDLA
jgi:hypothetical protein